MIKECWDLMLPEDYIKLLAMQGESDEVFHREKEKEREKEIMECISVCERERRISPIIRGYQQV